MVSKSVFWQLIFINHTKPHFRSQVKQFLSKIFWLQIDIYIYIYIYIYMLPIQLSDNQAGH